MADAGRRSPALFDPGSPPNDHRLGELQSNALITVPECKASGSYMAFEIVAQRDSETVTMKRNSSLIAIAKARVWASEGWNVTTIVMDEQAAVTVEEYGPSLVLASAPFRQAAGHPAF